MTPVFFISVAEQNNLVYNRFFSSVRCHVVYSAELTILFRILNKNLILLMGNPELSVCRACTVPWVGHELRKEIPCVGLL